MTDTPATRLRTMAEQLREMLAYEEFAECDEHVEADMEGLVVALDAIAKELSA